MDLVKYLILHIVLIRATKDVILTGLAKARDAKLLLGYLIPEVHGWLAALHTALASNCQHTAATKQPHGCILFELIHLIHTIIYHTLGRLSSGFLKSYSQSERVRWDGMVIDQSASFHVSVPSPLIVTL